MVKIFSELISRIKYSLVNSVQGRRTQFCWKTINHPPTIQIFVRQDSETTIVAAHWCTGILNRFWSAKSCDQKHQNSSPLPRKKDFSGFGIACVLRILPAWLLMSLLVSVSWKTNWSAGFVWIWVIMFVGDVIGLIWAFKASKQNNHLRKSV